MLRAIFTIVLLLPLGALAQSAPPDPMSLPTRDAHQDLTIVADPYLRAARYKQRSFRQKFFLRRRHRRHRCLFPERQ